MSLSGETKVGDLHSICRGSRRRGDEVRVTAESRVIRGGCRDEDVFGFDVAMEEVMGMDMVETPQDLVKDALDMLAIEGLVIPGFH